MFWIPSKKSHHHKHKKDKSTNNKPKDTGTIGSQRGPAGVAAGTAALSKAMMSGDSPDNCNKNDPLLELKDKPTACTSGGTIPKSGGETVTASVLVEPHPKTQDAALSSPSTDCAISPRPRSSSTDEEVIESATVPLTPKESPEKNEEERKILENGAAAIDSPDSVVIKENNIYPPKESVNEENEENCAVKCLYYTLQCCECNIM